jgi:hypothetical protein
LNGECDGMKKNSSENKAHYREITNL